jgi:hypothetical protein
MEIENREMVEEKVNCCLHTMFQTCQRDGALLPGFYFTPLVTLCEDDSLPVLLEL